MVSVGGFYFAIKQINKTKGSVESAERATTETRNILGRNLTINDLTKASLQLQQVKELHLANDWHRALDRYYDIRTTLADIRSRHPSLKHGEKALIQQAIQQFITLEDVVRKSLRAGNEPDDVSRHDSALSRAQTVLDQLASDLQHAI